MKAALILFNWFPHGGLQRDCYRIGRSLVKMHVAVDVLCMSWQGEAPQWLNVELAPDQGGSRVAKRTAFAGFVAEQKKRNQYDAVIGFNRMPGLDYYFAADTCFAWKATRERSWLYRLAPRSRQYLAFEKAVFGRDSGARIFMLSPLQKQEYLACYPECEERIIDIPPGIDRNRMAGEDAPALRNSFRQEFGIADETLAIIQVGSGFGIKGVDRSLEAIASLPDAFRNKVRFFVVGSDKAESYQLLADQLGIAACVTFTGGRDDLPRFLQGADMMLHPARKESAGMVILESVVAGLPVLATDSCGYAFHVERANAGKVLQGDFSQRALNSVLLDMLASDKRNQWQSNGIQYGIAGDFYDMPDRVAAHVLASAGEENHAR